MFARNVRFHVKDGKLDEFNKIFNADVLPILKNQKGFKNELTLVGKQDWLGISMWHSRTSADQYGTTAYPKVLEKLMPTLNGEPVVEQYEVGFTTMRA